MKFTVDRFEGSFAVVELEDRTMVDIPRIALPSGAKPGDIIDITIDDEAIETRRKLVQAKFDNLTGDLKSN